MRHILQRIYSKEYYHRFVVIFLIIGILPVLSFSTKTNIVLLDNLISAGYEHTVVINEGSVWTWGDNTYHQLGNGSTKNWAVPSKVSELDNIVALAKGSSANHTIALTEEGTLWAWGNNKKGQLGLGHESIVTSPQLIENLPIIKNIAVGQMHSVAVDKKGDVWVWGTNYSGLGHHIKIASNKPIKIPFINKVKMVACGNYHTIALRQDGTVWTWGKNTSGQLGIENRTSSATPLKVEGLSNIVQISAGNSHSLALDADGKIWAWGWNDYGQLGIGNANRQFKPVELDLENVVCISAGGVHSLALKSNGSVWGWGCNIFGQLGKLNKSNQLRPSPIQDLEDIGAIATGDLHSVVVKNDGTIITWGLNKKGQLGNNSNQNSYEPIAVFRVDIPDYYKNTLAEPLASTATPPTKTIPQSKKINDAKVLAPQKTKNEEIVPEKMKNSILYVNRNSNRPSPEEINPDWVAKGGEVVTKGKKTTKNYYTIPQDERPLIDTAAHYYFVKVDKEANLDCPIVKTLNEMNFKVNCLPVSQHIELAWSISSESDNIDFTIERSTDLAHWTEITPVQYMTETDEKLIFEATDTFEKLKPYYYRLKQIDCEGNYSYSPVSVTKCL